MVKNYVVPAKNRPALKKRIKGSSIIILDATTGFDNLEHDVTVALLKTYQQTEESYQKYCRELGLQPTARGVIDLTVKDQ